MTEFSSGGPPNPSMRRPPTSASETADSGCGFVVLARRGDRDARQQHAGERHEPPEDQNDFLRLSEIERGQTRPRRSGMLPLIAAAVWKSNG